MLYLLPKNFTIFIRWRSGISLSQEKKRSQWPQSRDKKPRAANLDYSRAEVVAGARHKTGSCSYPPQMFGNDADAARSARLKGK